MLSFSRSQLAACSTQGLSGRSATWVACSAARAWTGEKPRLTSCPDKPGGKGGGVSSCLLSMTGLVFFATILRSFKRQSFHCSRRSEGNSSKGLAASLNERWMFLAALSHKGLVYPPIERAFPHQLHGRSGKREAS